MQPVMIFYLCEVLSLAMIVIEIKYLYKMNFTSVLEISVSQIVKPSDMT